MEKELGENKQNYHWVLLAIVSLSVIVSLAILSGRKERDELEEYQWEKYYNNNRRRNKPTRNEENDDERGRSSPNQDLVEKGYLLNKDIKELENWDIKASEVPDLQAHKRIGVINTLSVAGKEGFCSELVIILKESPHVKVDILNYNEDSLNSMKIKQSREFANTDDSNKSVIKFAIKKLIEKGHTWKYDVYVLKANSNFGTISGPSAGSGVCMALLSAFFKHPIPKNLAITGEFKSEDEQIPTEIKFIPKKYQWRADRCANCNTRSLLYHSIYDKETGKLEQGRFDNATNPDSQWVFCNWDCYNEWWNENVYDCSECSLQRFGSCSCCGNYRFWIWDDKQNEKFCSKECIRKRYKSKYERGKIVAIGSISEKVSAAVEKSCSTIIISKDNSSNYYEEVPLSVRAKVRKLHEVESYQDLEKLLTNGL